jgi:FKBP-type peptidyl-prolyl cis-trans isomerase FkpA
MRIILLGLVFSLAFMQSKAQSIKLPSGIEYRYVKKGAGKQSAKVGDFMTMIIKSTCSGQVIFDSKNVNKNGANAPVNFPVAKPKFNGDVNELLKYLHEGDSVVVKIPQDSFYRNVPQAQRKGLVAGEPVIYNIGVHNVYTPAQIKKIQDDYKKQLAAFAKQQAAFKKQQQEQIALQKKQAIIDNNQDKELNNYFKANNILKPKKLPSGVYVVTETEGKGDLVKAGTQVTFNYEKYILAGKKFESTTDSTFKNQNPAKASIGQRQLIVGLEEGLQSFKNGGKGKIFIPSKYAYGSNKYPVRPNDTIPANSIIQVDIDVIDVADLAALAKQLADKEDAEIQAYLKTNNLNGIKTASGLYYVITSEGTGNSPVVGDEVSMNYTGMFLDGNKFDSNVDSSFSHVSPLNFPLGQDRVIKGWDEGIGYLKKGTKAKFILPSAIAYGKTGSGKIPADAILQFDVELLDFKKPEAPKKP